MLEKDAAASQEQVRLLYRVQPLAEALYAGRIDEAGESLAGLENESAIFLDFYRGELALLEGKPDEAMLSLERIVEEEQTEHRRLFPYFGRLRLAEAYRLAGDGDTAAKILDRAAKEYAVKDLIRHVTSARKRYYREN